MIPYNTDAPLYHLPIATVSLIVLNTLLFFLVPRSFIEPTFEVDYSEFQSANADSTGNDAELLDSEWGDTDPSAEEEIDEAELQAMMAMLDRANAKYPSSTLALQHGAGIKPWQWLTSIFMHGSFGHLLFNMIALWAFGLVIEGKVGWLQFLGVYLGIGVVQSGLEQLIMCLYGSGASIGASAAIFGILGVAVVWAPRNDFDVFFAFGFRAGSIEIPILMFGFLQFVLEAFNIAMERFHMSSGVMHMMGFALGIGLGFVWLVRGWVDCEGWDLITVLKGNEGRNLENERLEKEAADLLNSTHRSRSETPVQSKPAPYSPQPAPRTTSSRPASASTYAPKTEQAGPAAVQSSATVPYQPVHSQPAPSMDELASLFAPAPPQPPETDESKLHRLIEEGSLQDALRLLVRMRKTGPVEIPQPQLARLIRDLLSAKDYSNAIPLMAEHIRRFAENRLPLQINLSKLLLQKQRPDKALQVLRGVNTKSLDSETTEIINHLIAHAQSTTISSDQRSV